MQSYEIKSYLTNKTRSQREISYILADEDEDVPFMHILAQAVLDCTDQRVDAIAHVSPTVTQVVAVRRF